MIIIYADGGSYNNQSKDREAYGSFLVEGEKTQHRFKYGNKTNNEAEYMAVIFALKKFKALFGKKLTKSTEIELKADSELLVKQLNGEYKILDSKIQSSVLIPSWSQKGTVGYEVYRGPGTLYFLIKFMSILISYEF